MILCFLNILNAHAIDFVSGCRMIVWHWQTRTQSTTTEWTDINWDCVFIDVT